MAKPDSYSKHLTAIADWVHDGEDYLEIKRRLAATDLSEKDQWKLLSRADDFIVQREHYENQRNQALLQLFLGVTMSAVGFMFKYFGVNTGEGTGERVVSFAFIGWGLYLMKRGYDKYRKPPQNVAVMQEKKNIFDRYRTKQQ